MRQAALTETFPNGAHKLSSIEHPRQGFKKQLKRGRAASAGNYPPTFRSKERIATHDSLDKSTPFTISNDLKSTNQSVAFQSEPQTTSCSPSFDGQPTKGPKLDNMRDIRKAEAIEICNITLATRSQHVINTFQVEGRTQRRYVRNGTNRPASNKDSAGPRAPPYVRGARPTQGTK